MVRIALPLFAPYDRHDGQSKRAHLTCRYKCGDACWREPGNTSDNPYFGDVVRTAVSRRAMLRGTAGAAIGVGAASLLAACGDDNSPTTSGPASVTGSGDGSQGMNFSIVAPNKEDALVTSAGYEQAVVIRWGDPILPGAPKFDFERQSPRAQAQQFGYNNDFAGLIPVEDGDGKAVDGHFYLVCNNEYTNPELMFHNYNPDSPTDQQVGISMAAHGISIVEVATESGSGKLTPVIGERNRRITADTEFTLTGPAAGSQFVKTTEDPSGTKLLGTIANCSGGITPWGTMLSGEENYNNYFANASKVTDKTAAEHLKRYSFDDDADTNLWAHYVPRFDLAKEPNESNRFGYVVEVNPHDPKSTPVKHSALGRVKHESANIFVTKDGTVVAYTGDDEKFEYIYKFVSSKKITTGSTAATANENMKILDHGTLYVAQFTGETPKEINGTGKLPNDGKFHGSGTWIPLLAVDNNGKAESKISGMSAAEVSVFTRIAADRAGATKMDRPEDIEPHPVSGKVYCALTNNDKRGTKGKAAADEANPRNENKNGQVLEITDNHTGTDFTWELLLVCGDPKAADTYYGGFDKTKVSPISCPDNVAFDPHGNLWISTDGNALKNNDGLFSVALEGANRGETKQFLTVPRGAETCGPIITEDRVIVCVQHPGEEDDYSADRPFSHWPDGGNNQPRPSVVAVWKPGGKIGV
ncbi:putative phosphatase [Gordonia effusa NBRC 100432]|uniref:Putative phosphatase n=1 Tax=Gordonia effusa NBRC 100432 TaxID=1077974 RepID=H0QX36_9ACTN|nr:PhoX family phosphatase [Gordonia effusa]GAB17387.1 putative phosphatase [Gordonia effusa NBRC 100432]